MLVLILKYSHVESIFTKLVIKSQINERILNMILPLIFEALPLGKAVYVTDIYCEPSVQLKTDLNYTIIVSEHVVSYRKISKIQN